MKDFFSIFKVLEEDSEFAVDEAVNGEKRLYPRNGIDSMRFEKGDNKTSEHFLGTDKNIHAPKRRLEVSCISDIEKIGN